MNISTEKQKPETSNSIDNFFYEQVILLGRVLSDHQSKEDLIFRSARMMDWLYRRYTGKLGNFEEEIVKELLKEPYEAHMSTDYLLEKHFPEFKRKQDRKPENNSFVLTQKVGNMG